MRKIAIMLIILMVISIGSLSGCNEQSNKNAPVETTKPYEMYKSVPISKADLGSEWPLTVNSGYIDCYRFDNGGRAWFFRTEYGTLYYYNTISRNYASNYEMDCHDIDPIWASDPENISPKIDIGPFVDMANNILDEN